MTLAAIERLAKQSDARGRWVYGNWIRSQAQEIQAAIERSESTCPPIRH